MLFSKIQMIIRRGTTNNSKLERKVRLDSKQKAVRKHLPEKEKIRTPNPKEKAIMMPNTVRNSPKNGRTFLNMSRKISKSFPRNRVMVQDLWFRVSRI